MRKSIRTIGLAGVALVALLIGSCSDHVIVVSFQTGEQSVEVAGVSRSYYIVVPDDYEPGGEPMPVLFAYHGTGGTFDLWLDGYYDLLDAVGDEAIVVLTQALPDVNDVNQWDYDVDFQYFEAMMAQLDTRMTYDRQRVFVTGHSSGGGMAHELGCNYGDVIRGIAVHAGILRSTQCVGAVAVLQTHGQNDTLVPFGTGEAGHQFWVLYNGFELEMSTPGIHESCIDHSFGGSPYPMQWCLHQEGTGNGAHAWPSFGSEITWEFFTSLSPVDPGPTEPAGGGNAAVGELIDTTMSFTLVYPPGIGEVTQGSIGIYPAGAQQPLPGGPASILALAFDPGDVGPGSEQSYEVPIKFVNETFPGTYAFVILIYVADGGNPIPFPGLDHIVLLDIEVIDENTPIIIDTPLLLEEVFY